MFCLKVGGKRVSTIVPALGGGTRVTTPRHHVQYVVTEYGAVDLSMLTDRQRPAALIELADPEFRDFLARSESPGPRDTSDPDEDAPAIKDRHR